MIRRKLNHLSGMQLIAVGFFFIDTDGDIFIDAACFFQGRHADAVSDRTVYVCKRLLCDGTDSGRYLYVLVFFRAAGTDYFDSDRGSGIYYDRHGGFAGTQKKDRIKAAGLD